MSILESFEKNRTIRRFDRSKLITDADIEYFIRCASMVASAGNLQRLRYVAVMAEEAKNAFGKVSLGGYLPPEEKPTADVAPASYIIMTSDSENPDANLLIDAGIAAEAITLSASECGIGACMIRNFDKAYFSSLAEKKFPYPILVIALGYPKEEAKTVDARCGESLKYYKSSENANIVPKLTTEDLIVRKIL